MPGSGGCGGVFSSRPVSPRLQELAGVRVSSASGGLWWEDARRHRVVIVWFDRVTGDMLRDPGCVELIIARSSGYDHIDVEAASRAGVCVANQPEAIAESVAEHGLALILAALRVLPGMREWTRDWSRKGWPGPRAGLRLLYGRTVGFLGAGRIASALARRLQGFAPSRVLYYSRRPKPLLEQGLGAERASLEELFRESEVLVNTLPLTPETRGIVKLRLLLQLPRGAVYANLGRGRTEEPGAVCEAARRRPDLRFVLDVHPEEPLPPESPRLRLLESPWNVLTPHIAGASVESSIATTLLALMQARDYLERGCAWNPVTPDCIPCRSKRVNPLRLIAEARRLARELDQD